MKWPFPALVAALIAANCAYAQAPRSLAFQGTLKSASGTPKPDGTYGAVMRIYDAKTGGNLLWLESKSLTVASGLFQTVLGSNTPLPATIAFSDKAYYLGVTVGVDPEMTPRIQLSGVPYALALPGVRTELTVYSNDPHELGTPGTPAPPNIVAGYFGNYIGMGAKGSTIAGGGFYLANNRILGDFGFIGGGGDNQIGDGVGSAVDRFFATVAGGVRNTASQVYAFVGGGHVNTAAGAASAIAGGYVNTATGYGAFVGSGYWNLAQGDSSVIAGGNGNRAYGAQASIGGGGTVDKGPTNIGNVVNDNFGTIAGGGYNQTGSADPDPTNATYGTVGGGYTNLATGAYATIPGGQNNTASGISSFAAGNHAYAGHDGAFVWADTVASNFASTAPNQFSARATGGVRFVTAVNPSTLVPSAGVSLAPGDNAWSVLSDRNAKTDFGTVDAVQTLRSVAAIPIRSWRYKTQSGVRHIGPMAQDFAAAFHVGTDDRHISTVDADGVALAAIQGLYDVMKGKDAEITALKKQNAALDARLRAVEKAMSGPRHAVRVRR